MLSQKYVIKQSVIFYVQKIYSIKFLQKIYRVQSGKAQKLSLEDNIKESYKKVLDESKALEIQHALRIMIYMQ